MINKPINQEGSEEFITYFNGEMVPDSEVKVHYSDSSMGWGYSVIDCARTFAHRPFKLREHIERFYLSMKAVRIDPGMGPDEMERITVEVLEANIPRLDPEMDVWLNQQISGGKNTKAIGGWEFENPVLIISSPPLSLTDYAHLYDTGIHAVTPTIRHVPPQTLDSKIKHKSRLFMCMGEFEIKAVDPEAFSLFMDLNGNLTENKGANFLIYSNGVLRTPKTENSLDGVSRATVLELAEKLDIPTSEEDIQPFHVINAEEAFLCSTSYCILPVTRFNSFTIGNGEPGPVFKKIMQAWSELVHVDIIAQAQNRVADKVS